MLGFFFHQDIFALAWKMMSSQNFTRSSAQGLVDLRASADKHTSGFCLYFSSICSVLARF